MHSSNSTQKTGGGSTGGRSHDTSPHDSTLARPADSLTKMTLAPLLKSPPVITGKGPKRRQTSNTRSTWLESTAISMPPSANDASATWPAGGSVHHVQSRRGHVFRTSSTLSACASLSQYSPFTKTSSTASNEFGDTQSGAEILIRETSGSPVWVTI